MTLVPRIVLDAGPGSWFRQGPLPLKYNVLAASRFQPIAYSITTIALALSVL